MGAGITLSFVVQACVASDVGIRITASPGRYAFFFSYGHSPHVLPSRIDSGIFTWENLRVRQLINDQRFTGRAC